MATVVDELLIKIKYDVDGSGVKTAEDNVEGLGDSAVASGGKLQKLGGAAKAVGKVAATAAVALAAAGAATAKWATSQLQSIDATNKLSESVGIGVDEFQRLEFAGQQSGVSTEKLGMAFKGLNARLLQIKQTGTGEAKAALESIGLSAERLEGLTATEKLQEISTALLTVEDRSERSAIAARLFGEEAGPGLSNLLNQGGDAIADLAGQAKVLTQEQADAATEFVDRFGEMKNVVGFVGQTIAIELLPVLRSVVEDVKGWIGENDELLRQDLPRYIGNVVGVMKDVASAVFNVGQNFGELTDEWSMFIDRFEQDNPAIVDFFDSIVQIGGDVVDVMAQVGREIAEVFGASEDLVRFAQSVGLVDETRMTQRGLGGVQRRDGETEQAYQTRVLQADRAAAARQAAAAADADDMTAMLEDANGVMEEAAQRPRARRAQAPRRGSSRGRGGSAAAGGPTSKYTAEELFLMHFTGKGSERIQADVKRLASRTPSTRDIKPTVAIDYYNFNIEQTITTSDPLAAGNQSADAIKRVFSANVQSAADQLGGSLIR